MNQQQAISALIDLGLATADDITEARALSGGVSSYIWLIRTARQSFCVKAPRRQLAVQQDWSAPLSRNLAESAWLQLMRRHVPACVPEVLAVNQDYPLFVMSYLAPESHPLWKTALKEGRGSMRFAARVGMRLATMHNVSRGERTDIFQDISRFNDLRLDPYLRTIEHRHPQLTPLIADAIAAFTDHPLVVVHGDVSPKNILRSGDEPVFLDAECATLGDGSFDLAFVLTHLVLKCFWQPRFTARYQASASALADDYFAHQRWTDQASLDDHSARLLPLLVVARVDGKSPVEYLLPAQQHAVRERALSVLAAPPVPLHDTLRGLMDP